jgi:hypothetical protein
MNKRSYGVKVIVTFLISKFKMINYASFYKIQSSNLQNNRKNLDYEIK